MKSPVTSFLIAALILLSLPAIPAEELPAHLEAEKVMAALTDKLLKTSPELRDLAAERDSAYEKYNTVRSGFPKILALDKELKNLTALTELASMDSSSDSHQAKRRGHLETIRTKLSLEEESSPEVKDAWDNYHSLAKQFSFERTKLLERSPEGRDALKSYFKLLSRDSKTFRLPSGHSIDLPVGWEMTIEGGLVSISTTSINDFFGRCQIETLILLDDEDEKAWEQFLKMRSEVANKIMQGLESGGPEVRLKPDSSLKSEHPIYIQTFTGEVEDFKITAYYMVFHADDVCLFITMFLQQEIVDHDPELFKRIAKSLRSQDSK